MMEFTTLPSLASLANRVRALRRKLYRPRHEVLLGRHVNQLCEEWADAQSQNKPLPDPHNFIRRVADSCHSPVPSATWTTAAAAKRSPITSSSSTPSCPGVKAPVSPNPTQPEKYPRMSPKVPAP